MSQNPHVPNDYLQQVPITFFCGKKLPGVKRNEYLIQKLRILKSCNINSNEFKEGYILGQQK